MRTSEERERQSQAVHVRPTSVGSLGESASWMVRVRKWFALGVMVVTITSSLHGQRVERANRLAVGLGGIAARGDAVGTGAGLGASIHWYPSRQPWLSLVLRATASSFGDVKLTQRPWGVGATESVADYNAAFRFVQCSSGA